MHIPFSMSDEPDLGDEFKSYTNEDHAETPISWKSIYEPVYSERDLQELEEDLMYAREALRDVIDWANDPNGFSRNALIAVANRGLRK